MPNSNDNTNKDKSFPELISRVSDLSKNQEKSNDLLASIAESLKKQAAVAEHKEDMERSEKKKPTPRPEKGPSFKDALKNVKDSPLKMVAAAAGLLIGALVGMFVYVTKLIVGTMKILTKAGKTVGKFINFVSKGKFFNSLDPFRKALTTVNGRIASMTKSLTNFGSKIGTSFTKWIGKAQSTIKSIRGFFTNFINKFLPTIAKGLKGAGKMMNIGGKFSKLLAPFKMFLTAFKTFFAFGKKLFPVITIITGVIDGVLGFIRGFKETEGSMLMKIMAGLKEGIVGVINGLVFDILDLLKGMVAGIFQFFGFEKIAKALRSFSFAEMFKNGIDAIQEWLTERLTEVFNVAHMAKMMNSKLKYMAKDLMTSIWDFVKGMVQQVADYLNPIKQGKKLLEWGKSLFTGRKEADETPEPKRNLTPQTVKDVRTEHKETTNVTNAEEKRVQSIEELIKTERENLETNKKRIHTEKDSIESNKNRIRTEKVSLETNKKRIHTEKDSIESNQKKLLTEKAIVRSDRQTKLNEESKSVRIQKKLRLDENKVISKKKLERVEGTRMLTSATTRATTEVKNKIERVRSMIRKSIDGSNHAATNLDNSSRTAITNSSTVINNMPPVMAPANQYSPVDFAYA